MLRPRSARWFEILAARDDATLVLEALARTAALALEARGNPRLPPSIADVRPRLAAPNEQYVVEGGDHSLEVRKTELAARATTQEAVEVAVLGAIAAFCTRHGAGGDP